MCLECLKFNVEECSKVIDELTKTINETKCECCKNAPNALLRIMYNIKTYGIIKIRKHTLGCNTHLANYETETKQQIIDLLSNMLESVDSQKEQLSDGFYLRLMNNVNELNKYFNEFDDIEQRMIDAKNLQEDVLENDVSFLMGLFNSVEDDEIINNN